MGLFAVAFQLSAPVILMLVLIKVGSGVIFLASFRGVFNDPFQPLGAMAALGTLFLAPMVGLSVPRFAASDSVPSLDTLEASLPLSSMKANNSWFFRRLSPMSCAAYLPLPSTACGDRLGLRHPRQTADLPR